MLELERDENFRKKIIEFSESQENATQHEKVSPLSHPLLAFQRILPILYFRK